MEGRETMRRTGSPLQGEDLGGRRRSDGEGQNDEESGPLASSAAAPSSAVEMAEVIMRVIKEAEARERGRNPQSGTSSRIEIRQKTDLQTWTGVFKKGENVENCSPCVQEVGFWVVKRRRIGWCARNP